MNFEILTKYQFVIFKMRKIPFLNEDNSSGDFIKLRGIEVLSISMISERFCF